MFYFIHYSISNNICSYISQKRIQQTEFIVLSSFKTPVHVRNFVQQTTNNLPVIIIIIIIIKQHGVRTPIVREFTSLEDQN